MYKLFYYPRNASWAPHMVLHHLRVEYELILVDRKSNAHKSENYLKLNPTGRIPTLIDSNLTLFESAAICLHLCERHPEAGLVPAVGELDRANFHQWLSYLTTTVQPELMIYFYPTRHTTNPDGARAIVKAQEARLASMFAILDEALVGREFLVGSRISLCDYILFMLAHWGIGLNQPPLSYVHLGSYLRRMTKQDSVNLASSVEGTDLSMYS